MTCSPDLLNSLRSPSPEPIYNSDGKRLNTREFRVRKKLEDERHQLITQMINLNPLYKAPLDYKPPQTKLSDKVLIPQEDYPDINFVGLLIGPRGNTLKAMEKDTGAKIIIRGKGSIKEGKIGRKDGQPLPGEDEPLHAFLTAPTESSIQAATKQIMKIIKQAIELPENQNNLRRTQLRELALLNGTLRENDSISKRFCSNCGSVEHRNWQCPEKTNMVNTMHCSKCNGKGHLEKDCKFVAPDNGADSANPSNIDEEYFSFMAELGECSPKPTKSHGNHHNVTSTSNSTTTAADGGPLALTYDKISSSNEAQDSTTSSSNGQALLPTPGNNHPSSSSDKSSGKTVTWIQKQGAWKQVVQDAPESAAHEQATTSSSASSTTTDPSSSNGASSTPSTIGSDPMGLSYYNAYLQQALASGQDYNTAMATAQQAYEAYVAYCYAATSSTTVAGPDNSTPSASSKYSKTSSYNAVPPTAQLSSSNSTAYSYGYGSMPTTTDSSNYSAYAAYYQSLGSAAALPQAPLPVSQPPPPPSS